MLTEVSLVWNNLMFLVSGHVSGCSVTCAVQCCGSVGTEATGCTLLAGLLDSGPAVRLLYAGGPKHVCLCSSVRILWMSDVIWPSNLVRQQAERGEKHTSEDNEHHLCFLFSKDIYNVTKDFCSLKHPEKSISISTKILCSTTVFKIDNNQKCFMSSKSAYYYDFWRSCDTEDWNNNAKNLALITGINCIWTYYSHRNQIFKL